MTRYRTFCVLLDVFRFAQHELRRRKKAMRSVAYVLLSPHLSQFTSFTFNIDKVTDPKERIAIHHVILFSILLSIVVISGSEW